MKKNILIIIILAVLGFGGYSLFKGNTTPDSALAKVNPSDVVVTPDSYDIGRVLMKNGIVTREYEIKNNSKDVLRLKNLTTSCMCTRAQIALGDKKSRLYSMVMGGGKNPDINFDIPAGLTAKLIVKFDPAAHGPAGVGAIARSIYLDFLDPVGSREVKFSGEVALK